MSQWLLRMQECLIVFKDGKIQAPAYGWPQNVNRPFLECIITSSDHLSPFRDAGVSRHHVLMSKPPLFDPNNLYTIPGIFSLVVARTLTHNTQFLLDHKVLWTNLDEFITAINVAL